MRGPVDRLLGPDEPAPVQVVAHAGGAAPFVITCDHAGNAVPAGLRQLGLRQADLARHIGWDIGAAEVSRLLGLALGATTVMQHYSRLVIDCNRPPGHPTSVPAVSDGTAIPGNEALTQADRAAREAAIFHPYQSTIARLLDQRARQGQASILVAVHSFTPVFQGRARPMHAGMLFDRDQRLGLALGGLLRREPGLVVADNEPYALDQETDYTIPVHGEQRGLPCIEIEIRQDLIAAPAGQAEWAGRLARLLPPALAAAIG